MSKEKWCAGCQGPQQFCVCASAQATPTIVYVVLVDQAYANHFYLDSVWATRPTAEAHVEKSVIRHSMRIEERQVQ